jgi:hypothetical protein
MAGQAGVSMSANARLNCLIQGCEIDDHFFDTFTSRTCHGHALPCNSTGSCVSQSDAEKVYQISDWEYKSVPLIPAVLLLNFLLSQLHLERCRKQYRVQPIDFRRVHVGTITELQRPQIRP